jgi:hypothetical protein
MELMNELRTEGVITVKEGNIQFESTVTKIPKNMTMLMMSRIDRFDPDTQLLLRVASILGKRREGERKKGREGEGGE